MQLLELPNIIVPSVEHPLGVVPSETQKTFGMAYWKKIGKASGLEGEDIIAFARDALTRQNSAMSGVLTSLHSEGFSAVKAVRKTLASGKEVCDFRLEKPTPQKIRKSSPAKLREKAEALLRQAEELEKTVDI